jgi:uncharacterized membrane protein
MSLPPDANSIVAKPPPSYQAIDPLAVMSAVFGGLSILTMFSWWLAPIPLAGILLGWLALGRIRSAPNERTGRRLAQTGMILAALLWLFGCAWLIFVQVSEVPFGYQPITFEKLQPGPGELVPELARDMDDKKVFIKGYMRSGRKLAGIRDFVLYPNNGDCPFCTPNPKPTEKVRIALQGDLDTAFTTHEIGVAGRFRVDPSNPIPYCLEVDQPVR